MSETEYAIWLIPALPLKAQLSKAIRCLARTLGTPVFEPHVTLHVAPIPEISAIDAGRLLYQRLAPVRLYPKGIRHSSAFTKTLFIPFEGSRELMRILRELDHRTPTKAAYPFDPHLSLAYCTMPEAQRAALSASLQLPPGPYLFDTLRVITTPAQLTKPQQVRQWRSVFHRTLY